MVADDRLPWFPCFPAKLLGALSGFSSDQQLAYLTILLRIYEVWGPCRDTVDVLARRMHMNKRRAAEAIDTLFKAGKLYREGDGIMNPFAVAILADAISLHERRSAAGEKGAERRWKKGKKKQANGHSPAIADAAVANGKTQQTDAHLHLHLQDSPSESQTPSKPVSDWPADYQTAFWTKYPRKVEKKAALSKLDAVRKTGLPWARLIGGVDRYCNHIRQRGTEERYIKHPTTWLNQGCWDDEYGPDGGGGLFDGTTGSDQHKGGGARGEGFGAFAMRRASEAGQKGG